MLNGKKIIEIQPQERCSNSKFKNLPTVFLTNRMIYFNHEAAIYMKSPQHIRVVVDQERKEIYFLIEPKKTNKTYGIQRVKEASVTINGELYSSINKGILALVGIEKGDSIEQIQKAADIYHTWQNEGTDGRIHPPLSQVYYFVWWKAGRLCVL